MFSAFIKTDSYGDWPVWFDELYIGLPAEDAPAATSVAISITRCCLPEWNASISLILMPQSVMAQCNKCYLKQFISSQLLIMSQIVQFRELQS